MTNDPSRRFLFGLAGIGLLNPATARANALRLDFEGSPVGSLPAGIAPALTGAGGLPKWTVLEDRTSSAGSKVLAQTSADKTDYRFPLAIFDGPSAADVDVAVRFKPVAGEVDRAAGIAVRLADKDNYYVVRANALENNVRLYRMVKGQRIQFAGADAKVPSGVWQELRLMVRGSHFEVFLDGRNLYGANDATMAGPGKVALWTKADSVTYFDDLRMQTP